MNFMSSLYVISSNLGWMGHRILALGLDMLIFVGLSLLFLFLILFSFFLSFNCLA